MSRASAGRNGNGNGNGGAKPEEAKAAGGEAPPPPDPAVLEKLKLAPAEHVARKAEAAIGDTMGNG